MSGKGRSKSAGAKTSDKTKSAFPQGWRTAMNPPEQPPRGKSFQLGSWVWTYWSWNSKEYGWTWHSTEPDDSSTVAGFKQKSKNFRAMEAQITGTDEESKAFRETVAARRKALEIEITNRKPLAIKLEVHQRRLADWTAKKEKAEERLAKDQAIIKEATIMIQQCEEQIEEVQSAIEDQAEREIDAMESRSQASSDGGLFVETAAKRLRPKTVKTEIPPSPAAGGGTSAPSTAGSTLSAGSLAELANSLQQKNEQALTNAVTAMQMQLNQQIALAMQHAFSQLPQLQMMQPVHSQEAMASSHVQGLPVQTVIQATPAAVQQVPPLSIPEATAAAQQTPGSPVPPSCSVESMGPAPQPPQTVEGPPQEANGGNVVASDIEIESSDDAGEKEGFCSKKKFRAKPIRSGASGVRREGKIHSVKEDEK